MPHPTRSASVARASALALWLSCSAHAAWNSDLVPPDWRPPTADTPFSGKVIQDFSYAGYARGERPLPRIEEPVFHVDEFGADPSGKTDSTDAIQAAIDAAGKAKGGVVRFGPGTYALSPRGQQCLLVHRDHTVLRGDPDGGTRLLNTSTDMHNLAVVRFRSYSVETGPDIPLTADLTGPGRVLHVADASSLEVGDRIRVQWDFTDAWIAQHNQSDYWSGESRPRPATYHREVVAVDPERNRIAVDIPLRYELRTRDNARVAVQTRMLRECGMEHLSIGNVQHPGDGFEESDHKIEGTAAYGAHNSWAVRMRNAVDCWIVDVDSFLPEANTSGCHILSNGILISDSSRITVRDCTFQRPQYGGGGGNGYMIRLHDSDECLVERFTAEFSRHGLVLSHPGSAGNVFLDCVDRTTRRATGADGSYETGGQSSDHHMHFSHSNLFDNCEAEESYYSASHRRRWGAVPHALAAAHTVYWNTEGNSDRFPFCVESKQGVYGYVIGTRGSSAKVRTELTREDDQTTAPEDHVEGIGKGDTLVPRSLYRAQLQHRLRTR